MIGGALAVQLVVRDTRQRGRPSFLLFGFQHLAGAPDPAQQAHSEDCGQAGWIEQHE